MEVGNRPLFEEPLSKIRKRIENLGVETDFSIVCGQRIFRAHKVIFGTFSQFLLEQFLVYFNEKQFSQFINIFFIASNTKLGTLFFCWRMWNPWMLKTFLSLFTKDRLMQLLPNLQDSYWQLNSLRLNLL
jgi:hypothetical protein